MVHKKISLLMRLTYARICICIICLRCIYVCVLYQIAKKGSKSPRRLISIPVSSTRWNGSWTCEYVVSLKDLHLDDLAEDGLKDAKVFISLSIQRVYVSLLPLFISSSCTFYILQNVMNVKHIKSLIPTPIQFKHDHVCNTL